MNALASAILYFWPPDIWLPDEPTRVLIPSGYLLTNSQALVFYRAFIISSSVASGFPIRMFFFIVVLKRTGSYDTYPI